MYKVIDRILPNDTRGWLSLGVFILITYVLSLVAFVKDLDSSQLFTALASGVIGSAFGAIIAYSFATTKGSTDNRDLLKDAMHLAKSNQISVEPPATIKVEDESVRSE